MPCNYFSPQTISGNVYAIYVPSAGVSYIPGAACTLVTSVPHKTAYGTVTLPGPVSVTTNGSSVTIGRRGTFSGVEIMTVSDTLTYSADITSNSHVIPAATAYPTPTKTYVVHAYSLEPGTITGATADSTFDAEHSYYINVAR
jgi:hypothetical protein